MGEDTFRQSARAQKKKRMSMSRLWFICSCATTACRRHKKKMQTTTKRRIVSCC